MSVLAIIMKILSMKTFLETADKRQRHANGHLGEMGGLWKPPMAPGLPNRLAQLCGTVRGGSSRSG